MDEVKDKVKGLMKKVSSSSSSGRFHGHGRVLGSSSSSSSPTYSIQSSNLAKPKPSSPKTNHHGSNLDRKPPNGFDPFDSLITSAKTCKNGSSLEILECPICRRAFSSEQQVSDHVDVCLTMRNAVEDRDLEASICRYLCGDPAPGSVEVILRLLKNIVREPENPKFRRLRMSNAKIKEAVSDVVGGSELLGLVGFEFKEDEDGEVWATMEVPSEDWITMLRRASELLEPNKAAIVVGPAALPAGSDEKLHLKKIDRQTKVFFSVSENVASEIVLPDSFFNLSVEEVRREAVTRKKNLEDSKLLVPRTFKEKQVKATRKKYTKTIIRVQFPDRVVLQATFNPWEPTSSLYKFVSSALKEPSLEFELLHPVVVKRRVIPCFSPAGKNPITLEEEDLVPSALVKFRPIETDALLFTGLRNDLLEISEPLVTHSPDALSR